MLSAAKSLFSRTLFRAMRCAVIGREDACYYPPRGDAGSVAHSHTPPARAHLWEAAVQRASTCVSLARTARLISLPQVRKHSHRSAAALHFLRHQSAQSCPRPTVPVPAHFPRENGVDGPDSGAPAGRGLSTRPLTVCSPCVPVPVPVHTRRIHLPDLTLIRSLNSARSDCTP
jgi:hypothetical protein